jgi:hypothetical protein
MRSNGLLLFCVLSILGQTTGSQPPSGPYQWTGIDRILSLVVLPELRDSHNEAVKGLAVASSEWMTQLNKVWFNAESPRDAYLMDMTYEAIILQDAQRTSETKTLEVLKELRDDLAIRVDHAGRNQHKMSDVFVRVSVGGRFDSGWRVFHVLKMRRQFRSDPGEPLGPHGEGLVPIGRHLFWAERPGTTSTPKEVVVGEGKDVLYVNLDR